MMPHRWWRELAGGIVVLASLGAFFGIEFATNGHAPRGRAWLLLALPGLLDLLSAAAHRAARVTDRQSA